jgi:Sensors of blue-light using FAD
MHSLAFLCYQSDALLAREADLDAIAKSAGRHNNANDISGCLFHEGGSYYQYLEGPLRQLFSLMLRLEKDPRHRRIQICAIAPVQTRRFSSWPLAVLNEIETAKLIGLADRQTRQQKNYLDSASRELVITGMADILKNRRSTERQRA